MWWLAKCRLRFHSLFLRSRVERELREELQYHFDRAVEDGLAAGLPPDEARRAALHRLGPMDKSMEECRDMRGVNFIEHRVQDLRFACRQLLKHPTFAATAIFVLALGIGANVAIFAFVDAALVKPLPYQDPTRLVTAFATRAQDAPSQLRGNVSYQDFRDWREHTPVFAAIAAYDVRAGFTESTLAGPQAVPGLSVTTGFFTTLGVAPTLGRDFRSDEEGPGSPATVILSYSVWQSRFGGSPEALQKTVILEGEPHTIIGVLPRGFHFAMAGHADWWTTIRGNQYCWAHRGCNSLEAIGRLGKGVSRETAAANLTSTLEQLRRQYPADHQNPEIAKLVPLRDVMLGDVQPVLVALTSGAALLLLIACINVVSLLLSRSDGRMREVGVRNALGASSTRLALQFATEAIVLAALGGALGLALAAVGMRVLQGLINTRMVSRMPYLTGVGLDGRLIGFAIGLCMLAAAAFTFTPFLRLNQAERFANLREGSRGSTGRSWRRFGSSLVMVELGIAVVLLVNATLLGKSLGKLLHVDVGLNAGGLMIVGVRPDPRDVAQPAGALPQQVRQRIAMLPEVDAVGFADIVPIAQGLAPTSAIHKEGAGERGLDDHPVRRVSAGYFAALQARLLRGREFTEAEVAGARPVVILNETAALRYLPGEDPIGKPIVVGAPPAREVVGVVADMKDGPLETPPLPAAYVPFDHTSFALVIRTKDRSLFPRAAAAIREVRPGLLVEGPTTMIERIDSLPSASLRRTSAWLAGGFATIAFLLSVVGLYGVVAYSVGRRTREIGVRIALGAQRGAVCRMVLGEAARLIGFGTIAGLLCSVATATLMRNLLFGVQAWDGPTLVSATSILVVSALAASYIPARRAASVSPVEVLGAE
jgi:macrolide transport system ATP-binding/permease protein